MKAHYKKHILEFKTPSGTSRGILKTKEAWFIVLEDNGADLALVSVVCYGGLVLMTVQILNKHYNGFVQTSTLESNSCMTH